MTTQELIDYFAGLLILQYAEKPRAKATVQALVSPVIMDQLPLLVQGSFSIETATGVQMDVLGKYAGASRKAFTFSGQVTLDDDDYRLLLKMKVVQNNSGNSLSDIQNLLNQYFPNSIRVFDYQNMQMDYFFDSDYGSAELAEVFVRQGLLPKPMGVQLGALIYAPNLNNLFGMRTYGVPAVHVTGLNNYTSYQMDWTWLRYSDAVGA